MATAGPPRVPPGNWVARRLKQLNDESRGKVIPPRTAVSQPALYQKYSSVYDVQYSGMNEQVLREFLQQRDMDASERLKMEDARETVGDVFGVKRARKPNDPKMFSNWKVPSRFTADLDLQPSDISATKHKSGTDRLPRLAVSRSQSVSGRRGAGRPMTREGSLSPRRMTAGPGYHAPLRSSQPNPINKSADLVDQTTLADRKLIQQILRMSEKNPLDNQEVRRSVQPDVRAVVGDWMRGATEKDRAVAVRFFKSVSGQKLLGGSRAEQSTRLQNVLKALEGDCGCPQNRGADGSADLHPSLKHLRLLSPTSRKNRWMATTWHHLPEYRQTDPVNNWTSVYTRPHALVPRHFSIHPEWG